MPTWLDWLLSYACPAAAVLCFLGAFWVLWNCFRKWRSVPELWSIDWLDIIDRVKREFGVTLTAADFEPLSRKERAELTAGQLWEAIQTRLRAADSVVPADGWQRLVVTVTEAINVRPERVAPGSRLYADLGMRDDIL